MQGQPRLKRMATITIDGPVGCGKSIIADRIKKAIENEFGPVAFSQDVDFEARSNDYTELDAWQEKMVSETLWNIEEK